MDLIAYFSRTGENYTKDGMKNLETGNTEIVANIIHNMTNAELFKIETKNSYPYSYSETIKISKKEFDEDIRPELKEYLKNTNYIKTIYLGYPIWFGTVPMAVFSFLENIDLNGVVIKPFCTHEGSGLANSIRDLKDKFPEAIVKEGLAIRGSDCNLAYNLIKELLDT